MDYERCPYCAEKLDFKDISTSEYCPHCGKQFPKDFRIKAIEKLAPKKPIDPDKEILNIGN
ncbi:MAG: hypothetical protein KAW92_12590 [Candidatus Cloacimonetes bacterium]|nr:hypothetical protein [Candidatus Cloacimonadota bacterium]